MATLTAWTVAKRVNRALAKQGRIIRRARGVRVAELGEWYMVEISTNTILERDVDLAALGESLGVFGGARPTIARDVESLAQDATGRHDSVRHVPPNEIS